MPLLFIEYVFRDEQTAIEEEHDPSGWEFTPRSRRPDCQSVTNGPLSVKNLQVQKWRNKR